MFAPLLLAVDFLNFTYRTNPCSANVPVPVAMSKGSFSYFDQDMGAGFDLSVASVKEGSLAAGTRQAVVVVVCDYPIGGTAAAYLFDERDEGAVLVAPVASANWGGDWGRGPSSIRVQFANGALVVDQCKDDDCTRNVVTTYALRDGKLATLSVRTYKPPN